MGCRSCYSTFEECDAIESTKISVKCSRSDNHEGEKDRTVPVEEESGYHQQARVENTFFRYKTIVGPRLRARNPEPQRAEAVIACNILNRMTGLGVPEAFPVGA
jgi:hypothetical protein